MVLATRGTIVHPGPRRHMAALVYLKLLMLLVPELGWTIFGTYWAFEGSKTEHCDPGMMAVIVWGFLAFLGDFLLRVNVESMLCLM